jgi:two-component system cell cycle sensor histidine kinase/response regulator CckA
MGSAQSSVTGNALRKIDARPDKYIAITVSDTGVGMDAETCVNAFDPFFTTKGVGEGTGLGLSMVYGFVRQSGGYITLDSTPGHGTTFTIYLLTTTERLAETDPPAETGLAGAANATGTILVVDDVENLRNMLATILRGSGYTVITAGNGGEALPIGEHYEGDIDLLITDMVMPGMSGIELAAKFKAVRPNIPVLLISGAGDSDLIRRGLTVGNIELLFKPFALGKLLDTVNRILT